MESDPVRLAKALEADAVRYPEERAEILLEAAEAWRMAGEHDRASSLLAELIEAGGEDGCHARFQIAEMHFERGADDAAAAELAALARDPALDDGHCMLVAELLEERGDLAGAARWYDRAVACLDAENDQPASRAGRVDQLRDRAAAVPPSRVAAAAGAGSGRHGRARAATAGPPSDLDGLREHLASGARPKVLRLLTFQRDQRIEALRRWPEYQGEEYYALAEQRWRELAAEGVPSIVVVPALVDELVAFAERTGGSPTDSAVKASYVKTVPEQRMIAWPPPRNAACWCGSGTKYKKCCGRPG